MENPLKILRSLQSSSGLFLAAPSSNTGYDKAWIRDNIYASLGLELFLPKQAVKVVQKIIDILKKHEYKIDYAIQNKPQYAYQYIHARYNADTLNEFLEEWGNKQNDAVGALLFKIGDLLDKKFKVFRDKHDKEIVKKLVKYLKSIEYWNDKDNGMWEEREELHASSIGACLAGLTKISGYVKVEKDLIEKGKIALNEILPRESESNEADLALLSLIYPYNVVNESQKKLILENVERLLVKKRGVIRHLGDHYHNKNGEAEWTMGFPWLAKIYKDQGNKEKFSVYIQKTLDCMNKKGELPELYFANSDEHNDNSPLGWAQSLYLVALLS